MVLFLASPVVRVAMECVHDTAAFFSFELGTQGAGSNSRLQRTADVRAEEKSVFKDIQSFRDMGKWILRPAKHHVSMPARQEVLGTYSSPLRIISENQRMRACRQALTKKPVSSNIPHILFFSSEAAAFQFFVH